MKKNLVFTFFVIILAAFCISWGAAGHYKISYNTILFMNTEMSQFSSWPTVLADHASDADDRKQTDPNESPKHYIDIDNYTEFVANHRIPQTVDSLVAIHGAYFLSFIRNNGTLPWATKTTFDSLKACFQRSDWANALTFAADLGHYVGDGHMPLHITKNYDGRNSAESGIHSRYESSMIEDHLNDIVYTGGTISVIPDVNKYIFNYLYTNYGYIDSVLNADDYARSISSNTYSSQYKDALWQRTGNFTIRLFRNASHALTELIYTAWVQAGRPLLGVSDMNPGHEPFLETNYPNPFDELTQIKYTLASDANVSLSVQDARGKVISNLVNSCVERGAHTVNWNAKGHAAGVYFLVLKTQSSRQIRKMLVVH